MRRVLLSGVLLIVMLAVGGCGGGGGGSSAPQITEEQAQQFLDTGEGATEELVRQGPTTPETIAQTVTWLKAQPGMQDAGTTASGAIWFRMDSGAEGYVITGLPTPGDRSSEGTAAALPSLGADPGVSVRATGPVVFECPNPGGALLLDAWDIEPDAFRDDVGILRGMGYTTDEVQVKPLTEVTRSAFVGISDYSLVSFYAHGSLTWDHKPMLLLRERCPTARAYMLQHDPLTPVYWDANDKLPYYAVTAAYVNTVGGFFRRSVVILNACLSMYDNSFAQCFGASCLTLGWRYPVHSTTADEAAEAALFRLALRANGGDVKSEWRNRWDAGVSASRAARLGIPTAAPERGQSGGSDTVCLVANLTGSWKGPVTPRPTGDPDWGLVIETYGQNGATGHLQMLALEQATVGRRGLEFSTSLRNPNGEVDSGTGRVQPNDDTLILTGGPEGQTRTATMTRVSDRSDYDVTPPQLESWAPLGGTVAREFEVSLTWSEPMGNWWNYDIWPQNGSVSVSDWRYDGASRTTRYHVSVVPEEGKTCTLLMKHHSYCDIWGNFNHGDLATVSLSVP